MGYINPGLCCSIIIRLLESNRSFRNSLLKNRQISSALIFCFIFLFRQDIGLYRLCRATSNRIGTWLAAASTTNIDLYSSFKNEPPDTVASSWTSSISRTGPDPSVARNPFQPGRSLKLKEIFLSWRHSRPLCNPGQRRRLFSLLLDLHSAGSTRSN